MPTPRGLSSLVTILAFPVSSQAILSIATCQATIASALLQDPTLAHNLSIFTEIPATATNGSLTIFGCQAYCAPHQPRMNADCGNRLFQWFLPALFLVFGVATPPTCWRWQVWTALRPIADPFDAILSVGHRLSVCDRCYWKAGNVADVILREGRSGGRHGRREECRLRKSIALIFYTFPTVVPSVGLEKSLTSLSAIILSSPLPTPNLTPLIYDTAAKLAEDRTRGLAQAWFTVISCITGFVLATVPPLGGSSPSGSMVAAALVLAPLARDVLLGHAIGEVGSHHRAYVMLKEFVDGCQGADNGLMKEMDDAIVRADGEEATGKLVLTAGTSWYQPRRNLAEEQVHIRTWRRAVGMMLLLADTLTSVAAAAGALAAPPSYLNNRHFLLLGILGAWISSAGATSLLRRYHSVGPSSRIRRLGCLVVGKDLVLGAAVPLLFSATTCGWLSNCKLWSNYYNLRSSPRIPLDNSIAFAWNDSILYPALVCSCLGMKIATYLLLRWWVFRQAFAVLASGSSVLSSGGFLRPISSEKTQRTVPFRRHTTQS
ncbi:carboxylic ester hydrolase [Favolaschia claudopus]|uniref:Carboxylic ester hydrolase n=1 Tax=Favolaschia claudopus TaxID=2862362 RepID=A0AAW0BNW2_9AGAR